MLTLGRSLAMKPRVLLVDELSVGLAPLVVDRLFEALIATAREDGTAVLLVEQQARRALRVTNEAGSEHDGTTTLPTRPTEKFVFGHQVGRR